MRPLRACSRAAAGTYTDILEHIGGCGPALMLGQEVRVGRMRMRMCGGHVHPHVFHPTGGCGLGRNLYSAGVLARPLAAGVSHISACTHPHVRACVHAPMW